LTAGSSAVQKEVMIQKSVLGRARHSPFLRQLKKVYYFYQKEWGGSDE